MSTPNYNYEDPFHGAANELISAMSALNMPAEPLKETKGDAIYLSETDKWAAHAMEHLHAVHTLIVRASAQRERLKSYVTHALIRLSKNGIECEDIAEKVFPI